jgi:hypothetical protein
MSKLMLAEKSKTYMSTALESKDPSKSRSTNEGIGFLAVQSKRIHAERCLRRKGKQGL